VGTPSSASVSSADRTRIAFDRYGEGRPVILIGGAYNDRSTVAGLQHAGPPQCPGLHFLFISTGSSSCRIGARG
jgi:hypothetical protein